MTNHLKIINASIDVICDYGIRELSVGSVATEAEMDVSDVESIYSSKEKILEGLLVHINRAWIISGDFIADELSGKDLFCHQYLRWVRFFYNEQFYFEVLEGMQSYYGEECTEIMPAFTLREVLQKCKDEKLIKEGNIEDQLKMINQRLMGFIRWIHGDYQVLHDFYLFSHMTVVWDLIKRD